ncbi:carbohydrate ABC transporter membrane protein 2 (CUT1 family) [Scopulibacillus darangshiensis]|uniref:Carbohydrate ABC transporter membrane protein 2 (CUT1 family) n=1 Tax=Scopulibacillus darangshiensis TaxID=442528 RepID=A0A4V2SKU5_9BACL|nr:carbohydrate ABC transporter permease [Scopulibacillus darangshiensis]TCP20776.1 carbohydrate ABC transporter membrane protein 2 (CUT1 family) [Scopulibacillus darangshiensis]
MGERQYDLTDANGVYSNTRTVKHPKPEKSYGKIIGRYAGSTLVYVILIIYFLLIAYPLFWMVVNSLRDSNDIITNSWGLPDKLLFKNYATAWESGIARYFLNSVIVTGITCLLTILFSALAAYAFARFQFKGKNALLIFCIGGLMLAPQVSLIPLYKLMQSLNLYDTYWALILPYVAYRIPFILLLIRSYFLGIPREISESAYLDGCNNFQIFTKIFLPLSKPVLMTAAVLTGYFAWNEFMFAIVFISNDELKTVPAGLMQFRDALQTDWGSLLAGLTISALPIVLLFLFAQKYFIRGLSNGGLKG